MLSQPANEITESLQTFVHSTDDLMLNLLWLFAVLLCVLVALALWNIFAGSGRYFREQVSDLFLKVRVAPSKNHSHLRTLGMKSAILYTTDRYTKGQQLDLDVSSLPDFPAKGLVVSATVSNVSAVPGSESFLTKIEFNRPQHSVVESLRSYIRQLARTSVRTSAR